MLYIIVVFVHSMSVCLVRNERKSPAMGARPAVLLNTERDCTSASSQFNLRNLKKINVLLKALLEV